ncbi:MAG: hypothetical protein LUC23_07075 [Prevotellaceae bacterium]|nr:hypothetical protein [Prevotellaceae bacterium]
MLKKKVLFILLSLFICTLVHAKGGGLVVLIEQSPYSDVQYYYSNGWEAIEKVVKKELDAGRKILAVRKTPFTWFAVTAGGKVKEKQIHTSYTTDEIFQEIEQKAAQGFYVTSLGAGATYKRNIVWSAVFTKKSGVTDQVVKYAKANEILKWRPALFDMGYRITEISAAKKWMVVMSKDTDIDKQLVNFYRDENEMISDIKQKWADGYLVQLADCNTVGTYMAVYCTYKDGRKPGQYIRVCFDLDVVKEFIAKRTGNGYNITKLGGTFWFTDKQEVMGDLMGVLGSVTNIIGMKKSHKGGGTATSVSTDDTGTSSTGGGAATKSGKSCSACKGSGKCSANRNSCPGNGMCSYCNGDGFNYTAGTPVKCSACKGSGKCKYCNGSGICSKCRGTGKA